MTNLLISYPDIPARAVSISASPNFLTLYPVDNLFSGHRRNWGETTGHQDADIEIIFDMGEGNTASVDHCILSHADRLITDGATAFSVSSSDDGVSYSTQFTEATLNAATLYSGDYVAEITEYSARWHKLIIEANNDIAFSKIHLGKWLNLGNDPDEFPYNPQLEDGVIKYTSGSDSIYRLNKEMLNIEISWDFLSDTAIENWLNLIARNNDIRYLFLYTTSQHRILNDRVLLNCELSGWEHEKILDNNNNLSASFLEILG